MELGWVLISEAAVINYLVNTNIVIFGKFLIYFIPIASRFRWMSSHHKHCEKIARGHSLLFRTHQEWAGQNKCHKVSSTSFGIFFWVFWHMQVIKNTRTFWTKFRVVLCKREPLSCHRQSECGRGHMHAPETDCSHMAVSQSHLPLPFRDTVQQNRQPSVLSSNSES